MKTLDKDWDKKSEQQKREIFQKLANSPF